MSHFVHLNYFFTYQCVMAILKYFTYLFAFGLLGLHCSQNEDIILVDPIEDLSRLDTIHYLALGDSYTIGESVPDNDRFPRQLMDSLVTNGFQRGALKIIARTGWTTDELQKAIQVENPPTDQYNLVTLLIGVNNQYRGYPIEQFKKEFRDLLQQAIAFAGGKEERVFVVSIPDYGVTPFAATRNPGKIGLEIDEYNAQKQLITEQEGVTFVNITPISRLAKEDPTLVANDRLHPSGTMYTEWVKELLPEVLKLK